MIVVNKLDPQRSAMIHTTDQSVMRTMPNSETNNDTSNDIEDDFVLVQEEETRSVQEEMPRSPTEESVPGKAMTDRVVQIFLALRTRALLLWMRIERSLTLNVLDGNQYFFVDIHTTETVSSKKKKKKSTDASNCKKAKAAEGKPGIHLQ